MNKKEMRQRSTMDEFIWIKMFLCLMLMIQIAVSATETSIFIKAGDDVTLPCLNVIDDQKNCDGTTWTFASKNTTAIEVITFGEIGKKAQTKSDRLSVTANCSLVIKKLTDEDVGFYYCQQYKLGEGKHLVSEFLVDLAVITLTEDKDTDEVMLNCSLLTFEDCRHTVKWLLIGYNVDKQTERSQTDCFTTVSFPNSHNSNVSRDNIMKCQGTHTNTSKVLFTIIHQPSGEEAVGTNKTMNPARKTESSTTSVTTTAVKDISQDFSVSLRFIIVSVGLAALLITAVTVNIRTRTKGNKTRRIKQGEQNRGRG
ncbi:uncharacterized protein LOC102075743 isoform X1 [Oreochromis niloticus]|uniref:uncharacterized protein LOC102075743 isoform X1 n=1 Tax=Oreochromis niloticus TaxID=8128 RepID=UPI000904D406|nr:uncharacterized protein LOC102075743 isoform X1 [Oreochromis niloticus]